MMHLPITSPLISVIIPTYNYAGFLLRAIKSVQAQTYPNVEIIVIDDGSTDGTAQIVSSAGVVHYFYQENRGLAAARNTGIDRAKGKYLLFLDADDWLEPDALEKNFALLKNYPAVAFVSGNYYFLKVATGQLWPVSTTVTDNHYTRLLESNYIGMHATVLFQQWVFDGGIRYDETLRSCEDYDLYLRIARHHPILHHAPFIATYYFHSSGLSHNYQTMRDSITTVMQKQAPFIRSAAERQAYQIGLQQWREYEQMMVEPTSLQSA